MFFQKTLQEQFQEWTNSLSYMTQFNEISKTLGVLRNNNEPLQQIKQNLGIDFDVYNNLLLYTNDDTEECEENDDNKEDNVDK